MDKIVTPRNTEIGFSTTDEYQTEQVGQGFVIWIKPPENAPNNPPMVMVMMTRENLTDLVAQAEKWLQMEWVQR